MDTQYNLSNLEAAFKQYLLAVNGKTLNTVTIKNYLSDFRQFWGWINSVGANFNSPEINGRFEESPLQFITPTVINNYKSYLTNDHTPPKTINRRLSTLRKFGSFCISQGWMKENVFKKITNVIPNTFDKLSVNSVRDPFADDRSLVSLGMTKRIISNSASRNDILDQYQEYLVKQSLDRQNINSLIADVEEFINLSKTVL